MKEIKDIGLIGCGDFGEFMLPHLKRLAHGLVYVHDKRTKPEIWYSADIKQVASSDLVLLSVPSTSLESVLIEIKDSVKKDAVVADVCSVKVKPCQLMKKYLPETAEIIGTHPLFGPQSAKDGIEGLKIVLCPVRTSNIEKISCFLDNLGLEVIVTSPEEHDKQMAYAQGLTHFVAKALSNMDIGYISQRTKAYELLLELERMLENDSEELFLSIQKDNPYSKKAREKFLKQLKLLNGNILTKTKA